MSMVPIVIFAYNRPDTTAELLESLKRNQEAPDSDLYVFIDGPKTTQEEYNVQKVRNLFATLTGFHSVNVHASNENLGLARSVITGVSQILNEFDAAIVLEDDLIVSDDFLLFMNDAVATYRDRRDIWSISGYTPELAISGSYGHDIFLVPRPQCWGWATWRDRWDTIDWDVQLFSLMKDKRQRAIFNKGGDDLYRTLDMERHGRIESWAIRWCYAAYLQHSYTVNPITSKVQNIGMTDSDSHHGWHDSRHNVILTHLPIHLEHDIQPDSSIMALFKQHHDLGFISRVGYFMRRHGLGYQFVKKHL